MGCLTLKMIFFNIFAKRFMKSLVVYRHGVVDRHRTVLRNPILNSFAEIWLQPVTHQFAEIALLLEIIVVDIVPKNR